MKIKILANDGISKAGIDLLEKHTMSYTDM